MHDALSVTPDGNEAPILPAMYAVAEAPGDPAALTRLATVPGPNASERSAGWFHRYLRTLAEGTDPDILVVRRALKAVAALDLTSVECMDRPGVTEYAELTALMAAIQFLVRRDNHPRLAQGYDRRLPLSVRARIAVMDRPQPDRLSHAYDIIRIRRLGAGMLRRCGFPAEADRMERATAELLAWLRPSIHGGERYLSDSWTFAIGHQVMLAHLAYAVRAGATPYTTLKVFRGPVANEPLQEMIESQVGPIEFVPEQPCLAEPHLSTDLEMLDDEALSHFDFYDRVLSASPPPAGALLHPEPAQSERARALLRASGLADERPWVTLHNREAGFRNSTGHDLRNGDIRNYAGAVRRLVANGYHVVRMGDPSMTPLPPIEGCFDYALSPDKTPALDIALIAGARFHVGCSSGLSLVPLLFGIPTLFLNWHPMHLLPYGARNWIVLKALREIDTGVPRTSPGDFRRYGSLTDAEVLADEGLRVESLTDPQIAEAVVAFLPALDDPAPMTGHARLLVARDGGGFDDIRPEDVRSSAVR